MFNASVSNVSFAKKIHRCPRFNIFKKSPHGNFRLLITNTRKPYADFTTVYNAVPTQYSCGRDVSAHFVVPSLPIVVWLHPVSYIHYQFSVKDWKETMSQQLCRLFAAYVHHSSCNFIRSSACLSTGSHVILPYLRSSRTFFFIVQTELCFCSFVTWDFILQLLRVQQRGSR